jgi:hypothetical protein
LDYHWRPVAEIWPYGLIAAIAVAVIGRLFGAKREDHPRLAKSSTGRIGDLIGVLRTWSGLSNLLHLLTYPSARANRLISNTFGGGMRLFYRLKEVLSTALPDKPQVGLADEAFCSLCS